jgi:hypothetical protein
MMQCEAESGLWAVMDAVVRWFEKRGGIPLLTPPRFREYASLTDDPDKFGGGYSIEGIRGVAFGIEYCDSHGWTSTRTIRCLGVDARHPASITAYCHVRDRICRFRIDRIISITDLRSGRILSTDEHLSLIGAFLPQEGSESYLNNLTNVQTATRDGVFALLQICMSDGRLADAPRAVIQSYVRGEAGALGLKLPALELIELWIDNLAPSLDTTSAAVKRVLENKARFSRLLPWVMKIVRCQPDFPEQEASLRQLMADVREHFRDSGRELPQGLRALN